MFATTTPTASAQPSETTETPSSEQPTTDKQETTPFSDVDSSYDWAADAIKILYDKGIMLGNGDGTFSPNEKVSRAQFAAIIVRMVGLEKTND